MGACCESNEPRRVCRPLGNGISKGIEQAIKEKEQNYHFLTAEVVPNTPRNNLGEGLFWDSKNQLVRYLDIFGKKLYAYNPKTGKLSE